MSRSPESSAATTGPLVRLLLWLAAPAKISRFYLGILWLAWALAIAGWWFRV